MNSDEYFADEFDDLELRPQDKGKRPVRNPYSDSEDDEEEGWAGDYGEAEDDGEARADAEGAAGGSAARGAASASSPARGRTGAAAAAEEEAPAGAGLEAEDSEPGDLTCAICLNSIPLENLAMVKGCDHMYCAPCILHWALHKDPAWCPQCKQPFTHLLTYRTLDGELQDFPSEESVCLLKRARWFEEHLRFTDRAAAGLVEEARAADGLAWQDYAHDYDLEEDEEIESFYFSSAAGRARVVLGNRRYGPGGFISGGRRMARPVPQQGKRSSKAGKASEHTAAGAPPLPPTAPASFRTPNACGGRKARPVSAGPAPLGSSPVPAGIRADLLGSSPGAGASSLYGSSPSGSGRRARRNARRSAMDAGMGSAEAHAVGAGPSSLGRSVST